MLINTLGMFYHLLQCLSGFQVPLQTIINLEQLLQQRQSYQDYPDQPCLELRSLQ